MLFRELNLKNDENGGHAKVHYVAFWGVKTKRELHTHTHTHTTCTHTNKQLLKTCRTKKFLENRQESRLPLVEIGEHRENKRTRRNNNRVGSRKMELNHSLNRPAKMSIQTSPASLQGLQPAEAAYLTEEEI